MKRRKKRFGIHRKALTAIFLSLVLTFASVSSIQTQAEEIGVDVPPAAEEEPSTDEGAPENTEGTEGDETVNEPAWVKTSEGAVVLTAFAPLPEAESVITPEQRETLDELTARMPGTLKAYAGAYVTETPDEDQDPEEGDKDPEDEDKDPEEGDKDPEDEDKDPEEGDKDPGNEDQDPEEGDKDPGNEDQDPEEGDKDPGNEDQDPEEGDKDPGNEDQNPGEGDKNPEDANGVADGQNGEVGSNAADGQSSWHLFIASENEEPGDGTDSNGEGMGEGQPGDGEENKAPEDENKVPEEEPKDPEDENKDPKEPAIQSVEVEIPVTWECADYEQFEQGEQEEQKYEKYEYVFTPKWDNTLWFYDMSAEGAVLPTVTVRYANEEIKTEVTTQEELAAAFAAGVDRVVLKADIALTKTLVLPAEAKIELDGEGHSLLRGTGEDGAFFLSTMIAMEGEDYTEETFGTLTLKNITVDGKTETDSAAAPAILDRGELILEENAVVQSNCNYGTYPAEGEEGAETVFAYGGGIQVYGRLALTEEALVTGNFADELGGGVYLAGGASLWLYADVIRENTVSADGYGDDLYAAEGSTIYYDPSIDMTRKGFYLCEGVNLIPMGQMALTANDAAARGKEIYLHVERDSGYTDEQVEEIKRALQEKGYTVLTDRRIDIDATDLRDWYVYDHYDTNLWRKEGAENPPASWVAAYPDQEKRKYYPCTESNYKRTNFENDENGIPRGPATTIEEWLRRRTEYNTNNYWELAQFKEHIWSRKEGGKAAMTFAGYGAPAYVDFLFYDPQSDGEKVVNFDVDSSMVSAHTLVGAGFLLNTKIEDNKLTGYVVIYEYTPNGASTPYTLSLYRLDNAPVDAIHNFNASSSYFQNLTAVKSEAIAAGEWQNQMCVQIKATPTKIEVRQAAKTDGVQDASRGAVKLSWDIDSTGGSAFGPLVSYLSHNCSQASSYTYSNLSMYFTDAQEEQSDIMQPFERADFTQRDTQKYFVNLLGKSAADYNGDVNFGQYREYLKLLQEEGVALVTDRDTPFDDYLGEANGPGSNLVEFSHDGDLLSVEALVEKIDSQLKDRTTTEIGDKVGKPADEGGVMAPEVHHSAGNIWLKSLTDGSQVRKLYGDAFSESGYAIQIMDDITYYHGTKDEVSPVTYEILKPGTAGYVNLFTDASSGGGDAVPNGMGVTDDGMTITPQSFVVEKSKEKWPAGVYAVRQTVANGSICGYSFFDMVWGEQPPVVPDTPIPDPPEPEPEVPETPAPGPSDPPGPGSDPKPSEVSPQEPPVEYTEETVTVAAAEPMSQSAPEPTQEPEKKPGEPKTGDMPIAALPVSMGACTAFVMKLRLWLYELEAGISEEKKNAIIRSIIAWAKNKSMVKVYLALAATAVVVTVFHLLKTVCNGRRRVVALIDR